MRWPRWPSGRPGPSSSCVPTHNRWPRSRPHLGLPLQVVKVLVGDLAAIEAVSTHRGGFQADGRPDLALLERVLDGLQSL